MNEKEYFEDELPEPEGFWPDTHPAYQEPYEIVPYTPDQPEFTHPLEAPENLEPQRHDHDTSPPAGSAPGQQLVDEELLEMDVPSLDEPRRSWLNDPPPPVEQTYLQQAYTYNEPSPESAVPTGDPFSPDPFTSKVTDDFWVPEPVANEDLYAQQQYIPESTEENVRRSGLAWSAGIAFFGSVAFMLFLGWIVDLLLGTAPWGMVGGIVLGSVIGFIQFFRISSQIYGSNNKPSDFRPLLTRSDDPQADDNPDLPEPPTPPPFV